MLDLHESSKSFPDLKQLHLLVFPTNEARGIINILNSVETRILYSKKMLIILQFFTIANFLSADDQSPSTTDGHQQQGEELEESDPAVESGRMEDALFASDDGSSSSDDELDIQEAPSDTGAVTQLTATHTPYIEAGKLEEACPVGDYVVSKFRCLESSFPALLGKGDEGTPNVSAGPRAAAKTTVAEIVVLSNGPGSQDNATVESSDSAVALSAAKEATIASNIRGLQSNRDSSDACCSAIWKEEVKAPGTVSTPVIISSTSAKCAFNQSFFTLFEL